MDPTLAAMWPQMSFENRQAAWTGFERLMVQNNGRGERPSLWQVWVINDRIFVRHGLQGGAMQETDQKGKAKNVGKANYISPEQDALAQARRMIRKKYEFEGYDEVWNGANIDSRNTEVVSVDHLLTNLPSSFCLYKPENTVTSKHLLKVIAEGKALFTVKRNGHAFLIVKDAYNEIKIYSRRARGWHDKEGPTERPDGTLDYSTVLPWNRRFPQLVQAVQQLDLPPATMMAVEMCFINPDGTDHFNYVSEVVKSLTPRALALQEQYGWLKAYWWDVPFFGGNDFASTKKVLERYELIKRLWAKANLPSGYRPTGYDIEPIHYLPDILGGHKITSLAEAEKLAIKYRIEGWVVVDPDGIYGDRAWNLKGKPDRPGAFCAKSKPWLEDDFVAIWDPERKWGTYGKGRHEKGKIVELPNGQKVEHGGVGSVGLGQYNKKGELVYISDVSSGLPYEMQAQLRREHFPQVWRVFYTERDYISEGEDTNALTFAKVKEEEGIVRDDKTPAECVNERL